MLVRARTSSDLELSSKRVAHHKHLTFLYVALTLVVASEAHVGGQTPPPATYAEDLRGKYPWGNIYLTFSVIAELASLTKNQTKLQKLPEDEKNGIRLLSTLLNPYYYNTPINRAIGVLVLDLNDGKAGFKRADDINGAITPLPWSKWDVQIVATLCDKCLSGIQIAQQAQEKIARETKSIETAWNTFQEVGNNPYVSDVRIASLKVDLNQFIQTHPDKLTDLESKDQQLFASIRSFADGFDENTRTSVAKVQAVDATTNTIIAKESGGSAVTFPYSEASTVFVNSEGHNVAASKIEPGTQIGLKYSKHGDERAVTTVVAGRGGESGRSLADAAGRVTADRGGRDSGKASSRDR
jgi:hypothetical protein